MTISAYYIHLKEMWSNSRVRSHCTGHLTHFCTRFLANACDRVYGRNPLCQKGIGREFG